MLEASSDGDTRDPPASGPPERATEWHRHRLAFALLGVAVGTAAGVESTAHRPPAADPFNTAVSVATRGYQGGLTVWGQGTDHVFAFGRIINVTSLTILDYEADALTVYLDKEAAADVVPLHLGGGEYSRDFTAPIAATGVKITCNLADVASCQAAVVAFGY